MGSTIASEPLPREIAQRYRDGYAVVDVETSGLRADYDRVLQVAIIQLTPTGRFESSWSTLLDPGVDPGPVHIHGLTRERLVGSPIYTDVAGHITDSLSDRVLVAHNARFDWDFLAAEAARSGGALSVSHRLCTMALTRRLDLPVPDLSLAAVARYWGVPQARPHDAVDDTRVVVDVLRHSLMEAYRIGADLPLSNCADRYRPQAHRAAPRTPCPWRYPGRARPGGRLQQGMKVVFTGETAAPREVLIRRAAEAGLDVMNNVSSRTSLLICNASDAQTNKAVLARKHGTLIISEHEFEALLRDVRPGEPKPSEKAQGPRPSPPRHSPRPRGPLTGHRVLVLGGSHDERAAVRARIVERGGQAAVNLTASVTHFVGLLPSGRGDQWGRATDFQLPRLDATTLEPLPSATGPVAGVAAPTTATADVAILPRGGVIDLPQAESWSLSVAWPDQSGAHEIDVVAFVLDSEEQIGADEDFCFYNQPNHPSGAVELDLDARSEALATIRLDSLQAERRRITVAAAIDGEATFGDVGPIELVLRDRDGAVVARSTLDAATEERSMLLANVYTRNDVWRFRAVGQGYPEGLAHLAVLHGVDVED